jgi:hypothetical protein
VVPTSTLRMFILTLPKPDKPELKIEYLANPIFSDPRIAESWKIQEDQVFNGELKGRLVRV